MPEKEINIMIVFGEDFREARQGEELGLIIKLNSTSQPNSFKLLIKA